MKRTSAPRPASGKRTARAPEASDTELVALEALVSRVRATPGEFKDNASVLLASGLEEGVLRSELQRHYHTSLEALLIRSRLTQAKVRLLESDATDLQIARAVGYSRAAVFKSDFLRFNGLPPAAYRDLRKGQTFTVRLPKGYPLGYLLRALGRDPQSATEHLTGRTYTAGIRLGESAHRLQLEISDSHVAARVALPSADLPHVHAMVIAQLGLDQETTPFAALAASLDLHRLVEGRTELRIAQTHTVFDGLIWAIVGQQINLTFASLLKRRLMEKTGTSLGDGLFAPPTPRAVAALQPEDLLPLQYSRQKADYVTSIARLVTSGSLDLEALRTLSATRAERTLLAIRGLGPWSVNYLMMRSLGFADCLPLGDTGVTSGLLALFALDERPNARKTLELMERFSPFRSLATAHLWQFNKPLPE